MPCGPPAPPISAAIISGGIPPGAASGGAPGGIISGGIPGGGAIGGWGPCINSADAGAAPMPCCWARTGCKRASTSWGVSLAARYPTMSASSSIRASTERMSPRKLFIKISGDFGERPMTSEATRSSSLVSSVSSSSISIMSLKPAMMPMFSTSCSIILFFILPS